MSLKQNIIYLYFKGKHLITSKSQYQYNHGQYLYFADLNLPQAFEVHFSNKQRGESKTQIGSNKLVEIPDEYFWSGALEIYAWIYLHSGNDDGETIYEVKIPLIKRAKPTDEEPLPVQQSAIDKAIAELNNAVDITNENVNKTNADKTQVATIKEEVVTLKEGIDSSASAVNQDAQSARESANASEQSAQNSAESERKALDYSDEAKGYAQSALESKNTASQKAQVTTDASAEAKDFRDEAETFKNEAEQAKQNIVNYRNETKGYRDETLTAKDDAQTIKGDVQLLKTQIDKTATDVAINASGAKSSADLAYNSAISADKSSLSASQFADEASDFADSANQSANQAEEFKNQSATNVTHYPKVVDGYWYVWDASNNEYVNTNVDASGEDGISPTVTITNNETQGTHFIKITDKDGYKTATISDGLTVVMSPSSFVIPTDENGILINNVPLKVTFRAYRAKTPLTLSITNAETITLINPYATEIKGVIWGYTASSTEPYVNATLPSGYKLQGGDSGKFEFTVKVDDKSIVLNSTWALAKRGKDGTNGIDGYSPTANVSKSGKVATITITDKTGTTSAQVEDGTDGTDGVSPTVTITSITGGHRITITDADGEHSADVMDGTGNVDDVQINGTSIVSDGVANVPYANTQNPGVVKVNGNGLRMVSGGTMVGTDYATEYMVKVGINYYNPIVPALEGNATFYGLAKSAGDTTQSQSSNAVGVYTDTAKSKIQTMLGIADLIGNSEGATASKAYSVGNVLLHDGKLYKVTASIAQGSAIVPNTNCTQTTIIDLLIGV